MPAAGDAEKAGGMNSPVVDDLIKSLPAGLDRAILRQLSWFKGRDNAISRNDLVTALAECGFHVSERQARACISQFRKSGVLIGSLPGVNGGYYMIQSLAEFDEFKRTEYLAKIRDMQETLAAMDATARQQYGENLQPSLF
jgi:predicted DNA-binding transcriptional regulator YafY